MSNIDPPAWEDMRPLVGGDHPLRDVGYLVFPFRVTEEGPAHSNRAAHVREQIEMVLFTAPGERPHRPDFGVGVDALVFEPGGDALVGMVSQRLTATLAEALAGEVDPESIRTAVEMRGEATVVIHIGYRLATIGRDFEHEFTVGAATALPSGGSVGDPS